MRLHELCTLLPGNIISMCGKNYNGIYKVHHIDIGYIAVVPLLWKCEGEHYNVFMHHIAHDNQLYDGTVVKVLAGDIRHFDEFEHYYQTIHCNPKLSTESELDYAHRLISDLPDGAKNASTLQALYRVGPLDAGDLPSKAQRDWLMEHGYCAHIVVKGEDGYYACTGLGRDLYKLLEVYNDNTQ